MFVGQIFQHHQGGIYFEEFVKLCTDVASDMFTCIFDCLYKYVPCI